AGFEPAIYTLRGCRPRPLDDGATLALRNERIAATPGIIAAFCDPRKSDVRPIALRRLRAGLVGRVGAAGAGRRVVGRAAQTLGKRLEAVENSAAHAPANLTSEHAADQRAGERAEDRDRDKCRADLGARDHPGAKAGDAADSFIVLLPALCHIRALS